MQLEEVVVCRLLPELPLMVSLHNSIPSYNGARSVRREKNRLCPLSPIGKSIMTFMLHRKIDMQKSCIWFFGH